MPFFAALLFAIGLCHYLSLRRIQADHPSIEFAQSSPLQTRAVPPVTLKAPPLALLDGWVDCDLVDRLVADPSLADPVNWRSMAGMCKTSLRSSLRVRVAPAYLDTYKELSKGTGVIEEAFVSFIQGDYYAQIATPALRAAQEFSSRPTIMLVTGSLVAPVESIWPPAEFPRLVVIERPEAGSLHAWFDKLVAIAVSPVIRGAIIESDTMITTNADRLFEILREHGHMQFPLLASHQDARWPDCSQYKVGRSHRNALTD